jgi:hypothetical protein
MARTDKFPNDGGAGKAGCARNKNKHDISSGFEWVTVEPISSVLRLFIACRYQARHRPLRDCGNRATRLAEVLGPGKRMTTANATTASSAITMAKTISANKPLIHIDSTPSLQASGRLLPMLIYRSRAVVTR